MHKTDPGAVTRTTAIPIKQQRLWSKRRSRLAAVALLVAMPFGVLGSQAGALTTWKTFANGTAAGLGPIGGGVVDPSIVFLDSITRENPARIRLVAKGPSAGRANIRWHMVCGNSPTDLAQTKVHSFKARLPRTVDLSDKLGGVRNWRFCGVDAQVIYRRAGTIKLLLQARYQDS